MQNRAIYLLSPKEYKETISLPMIGFNRVLNTLDFEDRDTLLFTSKQAIYFTNEINSSWKDYKILAVGNVTAKVAKKLGAKDVYHPKEFYGEVLAKDIVTNFKDRKILYLRPRVVSFDSRAFLSKFDIDIKEKILYETNCVSNKDKELQKGAVIIFTSPSTIKCFFKSFEWDSSYTAIVIGKSTLEHIPDGVDVLVSDTPTIESCIKKAKSV